MNQAVLRGFSAALLALACTAWAPAQEEAPKPKLTPAAEAAQDAKIKAWEKKAKARAKADAAAKARAIDINHASKAELKKLPGMTDAYVEAIIANRPYKVKADLVVKKAIPMDLYQTLRKQVKVAAK